MPLRRPEPKAIYFFGCVANSLARISEHCPDALVGIDVGVEEVPHMAQLWAGDRVPLAAALEATPDRPAQIVVFRRPLEHRAASRRGLAILVHRTVVEQLSALTGRPIHELDPDTDDEDDF